MYPPLCLLLTNGHNSLAEAFNPTPSLLVSIALCSQISVDAGGGKYKCEMYPPKCCLSFWQMILTTGGGELFVVYVLTALHRKQIEIETLALRWP